MPLDTRGEFYDGTAIENTLQLSEVLLKRPVPLMRTLTENLMAYALGRRVEYYDQPTIPRHHEVRPGGRLQDCVAHHRRRQKRRLPDETGRSCE
jgi:hypothetical protein